jgi:hypothetical protein
MPLTMRPTGGHSPVYADRQDWTIFDDGKPVAASTSMQAQARPPSCAGSGRSSCTVNPRTGIITSGKVPTLDAAKAQFEGAWQRWLDWVQTAGSK